jgi:RNA polymerase sigma-70 factor (ECF subfamily)
MLATLDTITDADLVAHALAGHGDAYAEILRRYQRPVFTLVLRMVKDRSVAEELAQDAFLKAFEKLSSYDPSRKFSSWTFKIAHNTTIDHLRRRHLSTVSLDEPVGGDADGPLRTVEDTETLTPDADLERLELSRAQTAVVGELRPEYREVVLLRYQAGLEYAEIAEAAGLPLGTVKTYIHRARKELVTLLEARGIRPDG